MRSAVLAILAGLFMLSACEQNPVMSEIEKREKDMKAAESKQAEMDKPRIAERQKTIDLFQAADAAAKGVRTTASGLRYVVLKSGGAKGALTKPSDMIVVHYEGWLLNGKVFDSSYQRGEPQPFQAGQLIPAWVEALQMMRPGDQWEIYAPSQIAYGEQGADIPPNSDLVFRLEILQNMTQGGGAQ
jgi:FKBP-type peptidyl-prolyl cis-trans isomerase